MQGFALCKQKKKKKIVYLFFNSFSIISNCFDLNASLWLRDDFHQLPVIDAQDHLRSRVKLPKQGNV